MSQRKQILEFVKRLDDLPARSEDLLTEFTIDLKFSIQEIFGPDSQYLDYLKRIKFRPEAVFVTDRELQRCWYAGIAQIANLLKVILHDPLVKADPATGSIFSQDADSDIHQNDISSQAEFEIRDSFGKMKQFLRDGSTAPIEEDGPINEPLRRDFLAGEEAFSGKTVEEVKSSGRILLIPGSDQLVNNEVAVFLRSLVADVSICSSFEDHGPFVDRLNRYADTDFAIVVLSPDFLFYPRTQAPENANVMASQEMIFQLGYLVAKLGRQKVIVLFQEQDHFRRPTDYFDLYYVSLNPTGAWKADIVKRMQSSGISVPGDPGHRPVPAKANQLSR